MFVKLFKGMVIRYLLAEIQKEEFKDMVTDHIDSKLKLPDMYEKEKEAVTDSMYDFVCKFVKEYLEKKLK